MMVVWPCGQYWVHMKMLQEKKGALYTDQEKEVHFSLIKN
jgi:hypothetical protein